jgi:hypothetical protein
MGSSQKVVRLTKTITDHERDLEFSVAPKRNSLRSPGLVTAALALAGCTSAVVIESEFPVPLVDELPVSIAVYFDPALRDFIHAESLPRSSTWTIDLGDANIAMLYPLYAEMFAATREIQDLPPSPSDAATVDGVLSSALQQFQFDVPRSTRDEFVEVWLQYRLQLLKPDGEVVIEWDVPGYGKAEIDGTREDAVHRASIIAMREAGARISTQFSLQPQISGWLEDVQNGRT